MSQDDIRAYISKERKRGVSDGNIRQELLAKGWDSILIHRELESTGATATLSSATPLTGSHILLVGGVVLILIGAIVFLGYGWPQLNPLSRFLFIAIPNLLLYLTGSYFAKGEEFQSIKETVHTAGHILLPVSVGVFLFQFGYYLQVDALLMALSVLIALPVYLYAGLHKRQEQGLLLIIIAAAASTMFLFADNVLVPWQASGLTLLVGLITLASGLLVKQRQDKYLTGLVSVGTAILLFAWPATVGNLLAEISSKSELRNDFNTLLYSLVAGGGLFALACWFGKLFVPWTRLEFFNQRVMLVVSILIIFFSLMGGGSSSEVVFALLSLALAALLAIIGYESRVKLVYWLSLAGGAISLLTLLFSTIDRVVIIILMFALGFLGIYASIYMAKRAKTAVTADETPRMSIGLLSDSEGKTLPAETSTAPSLSTIIARILLVLVLYFLLQTILGMAIGGFGHNDYYKQPYYD